MNNWHLSPLINFVINCSRKCHMSAAIHAVIGLISLLPPQLILQLLYPTSVLTAILFGRPQLIHL